MKQLVALLGKVDAVKVLTGIERRLKDVAKSQGLKAGMNQDEFLTVVDEEIERVMHDRSIREQEHKNFLGRLVKP